jgi:hypothetical protein
MLPLCHLPPPRHPELQILKQVQDDDLQDDDLQDDDLQDDDLQDDDLSGTCFHFVIYLHPVILNLFQDLVL